MATAAERFTMPDGTTFVVETSSAATAGRYVQMLVSFPPGTLAPPPHLHPKASDAFEVIDGTLDVKLDGDWRRLDAGDRLVVPPGTLHTVRNRSDAWASVRARHAPAMRFEEYLERLHAVVHAHGLRRARDPRIAALFSMVAHEYADTVAFGRRREQLATRALAGLGHLLASRLAPAEH